ncbi:MAG: DUF4249 domain-containing protein, partial [Hymenobacter sp.]
LTTFWRAATALGVLGLAGCIESYVPDVLSSPTSYLVVDGSINGNGVTRIALSRTISTTATTVPPAEKGARLFIVDNTGQRYALAEKASGTYQSDSLQLDATRQYQLRITTAANATYQSDLTQLKVTPPIDDLNLHVDGTEVQVQLSTHDATGQSRYYRWNFVETWEFNAGVKSALEYEPVQKTIIARLTPIYTCWRTERPSLIKQSSSAQLSQDALLNTPVLTLSGRSERLQIRYSVLVSQVAETPEEFTYFDLLRKNTEAVGSVNDPLPTQLTGNVHRLDDATEPVLGFVGVHTTQTRRFFINRQDLPAQTTALFDSPYSNCMLGYEFLCDPVTGECIKYPDTRFFNQPGTIPVDYVSNPDGYSASSPECADCRLRGSITKPSFW